MCESPYTCLVLFHSFIDFGVDLHLLLIVTLIYEVPALGTGTTRRNRELVHSLHTYRPLLEVAKVRNIGTLVSIRFRAELVNIALGGEAGSTITRGPFFFNPLHDFRL